MRVLLDTVAFLFAIGDPDRLSRKVSHCFKKIVT